MDPSRTALLVGDVQQGYLDQIEDRVAFVAQVARIADAARRAGWHVVHTRIEFRPDQPELSARNRMFGRPEVRGSMIAGTDEVRTPPELAARPGELVLPRSRTSAFAGSGLAGFLRAQEVTSLVLVGVATSGVVLATACAADDLDYETYVLADGVADPEPRVQDVLLTAVLPQYAVVVRSSELLGKPPGG